MRRTSILALTLPVLLACACSATGEQAQGPAGRSPGPPPVFTLTPEQAKARLIAPIEVMGTDAKTFKFGGPPNSHDPEWNKGNRDSHSTPVCNRRFVYLSKNAQTVRTMYYTEYEPVRSRWTHSWRAIIGIYAKPEQALADAQKIRHPSWCKERQFVPRKLLKDNWQSPAHYEEWKPHAPNNIEGWGNRRVNFNAHYKKEVGRWSTQFSVYDIAVRGNVLIASLYFTQTADRTPERVEKEASEALTLQLRRLTNGEAPCISGQSSISCQPRRTASPVPGH